MNYVHVTVTFLNIRSQRPKQTLINFLSFQELLLNGIPSEATLYILVLLIFLNRKLVPFHFNVYIFNVNIFLFIYLSIIFLYILLTVGVIPFKVLPTLINVDVDVHH